ncbi:hypothetical protein SAMD00079811_38630 [Scytonema sp. HK-05]|uniref:GTPase domain-containing protein n=1 Tax=Scytonema sp. HK-05 TaxID=1137095 RepID=UPI0009379898|nr:GTPase domain-containing protein [Scytonema sp. HK-05]OKH59278.1 hypothetical protein NIES2130_09275 [Scytonema sp. HK-05]BAY46255.1 hypothetical protein SAMD00079811_38630 [Scytonema sp. HK-05]
MAGKRRWKQWFGRFTQELNLTSGLASLGGLILSIIAFVGLNAFSSTLAALVGILGIIIAVIAITIPAWKAIPPRLKNANTLVGQRLNLEKLQEVDPPLLKLGVVGPELVGKSTLLMRILHQTPAKVRTDTVHAYVTSLKIEPFHFIALLDGPGEMYANQFQVATPANILLIVLDHHASDNEKSIDEARIQKHIDFQKQLRWHLREQNNKPASIHLLLNKRDLWEKNSQNECIRLKKFLESEEKAWKDSNLVAQVTSAEHSNERPNDIAQLVSDLKRLVINMS